MQLWKKNFLVTFFMFLVIIQGSLLMLQIFLYRSEMEQWVGRAIAGEKSILYFIEGNQESDKEKKALSILYATKGYTLSGIKLQIVINNTVITNSLPDGILGEDTVQFITWNKTPYILIQDRTEENGEEIRLTYMESMKELSQNQKNRTLMMVGMGMLAAIVIGVMLYLTMRRINRPVSQIAHELRTPLTGIQGYAQYLMMGNLTEEDRFFAAQQIVESSRNLNDIVEKLLIMGGVREGNVHLQKLNLPKVLEALLDRYPQIHVECRRESLQGDETLVYCLLENLIQNALAAGGSQVKIYADEYCMTIWNDGEPVSEKQLKWMNRTQGVPAKYADRHGFGIKLCHDITSIHGWRLFYRSGTEEGTTAEILL